MIVKVSDCPGRVRNIPLALCAVKLVEEEGFVPWQVQPEVVTPVMPPEYPHRLVAASKRRR
jgi:hypothetical protein